MAISLPTDVPAGDATVLDLDLRAGINRQSNQSVELTAFHNANPGGTRE
jgi:hypothetical protein